MSTEVGIDWPGWLRRWDAQQTGYVPDREARFTAMLDILDQLLPATFVAVDLGCGPGSISQRLLDRFPAAQAIAVDMDPVMLALGQGALGTVDGRLRWVDADLASPSWTRAVGTSRVDAVLSSTALHWLPAEALNSLYRDLARLLPPGGVFLNADHLPYGPTTTTLAQVSEHTLDELWSDESFATRGVETAEQWWEALAQQPGLAALQAERTRRFDSKPRPQRATSTTTSRRCDLPASARPAPFGRPSRTECYWPCGKPPDNNPQPDVARMGVPGQGRRTGHRDRRTMARLSPPPTLWVAADTEAPQILCI